MIRLLMYIISVVIGLVGYEMAIAAFGYKGSWGVILLIISALLWRDAAESSEHRDKKSDSTEKTA